MLNPPDNVSDFFVMDTECEKVVFIAENIRAIMLGREVNVIHNFMFFSMEGVFLGKQTFEAKSQKRQEKSAFSHRDRKNLRKM